MRTVPRVLINKITTRAVALVDILEGIAKQVRKCKLVFLKKIPKIVRFSHVLRFCVTQLEKRIEKFHITELLIFAIFSFCTNYNSACVCIGSHNSSKSSS